MRQFVARKRLVAYVLSAIALLSCEPLKSPTGTTGVVQIAFPAQDTLQTAGTSIVPHLTATVGADNAPIADAVFHFSSADPSIAEVKGDTIEFHERGRVAITWTLISSAISGPPPSRTDTVHVVADRITVDQPALSLEAIDATAQLAAEVFKAGSDSIPNIAGEISWSSSNPAIAKVANGGPLASDKKGLVTAVGNGNAKIYAVIDNDTATTLVTVGQKLAHFDLGSTVTIDAVGGTATITPIPQDAKGKPITTATTPPSWFSRHPEFVTVNASGVLTAVANGSSFVVASAPGGVVDSVEVKVIQKATRVVILSSPTLALTAIGDTLKLSAASFDRLGIALPSGIKWSTSAVSVAQIDPDKGLITAVGVGSATLTASQDGATATASITITNDPTKLEVSPDSVNLTSINDTVPLSNVVRNHLGAALPGIGVTWKSLDSTIARVLTNGNVIGVATGKTRVVGTAAGGPVDTSVVVVTNEPAFLDVIPISAIIASINDTISPPVDIRNARGDALNRASAIWSSSDPAVVRTTSTGLVIATGAGSAFVRAVNGNLRDSLTVTVTNAAAGVTLTHKNDTLTAVTQTLTYLADVRNARGSLIASAPITWTSSDPTVATISAAGVATAKGIGTTTITGTSGAASDVGILIVRNDPVVLDIAPPPAFTSIGDTATLSVSGRNLVGARVPAPGTVWKSLDTTIARIDATTGKVEARAPGSVNVQATWTSGISTTANVTVTNAPELVAITPDTAIMASISDTLIGIPVDFRNGRGVSLARSAASWSSADLLVAKVTADGTVIATGAGSAYVIAASPLNSARRDSVLIIVRNAAQSVVLNRTNDTLTAPTRTLSYAADVLNARGAVVSGLPVTWRSTDPTVASIAPGTGLATAQHVGTTLIIGQVGTGTEARADTAELVVLNTATSLAITPSASVIIPSVGGTALLGANARNDVGGDVTGLTFVWTSSDPTVATVDATGVVTGLKVGTTTVKATLGALNASASVTITNAPDTVDITPTSVSLASVDDSILPPVHLANALGAALPRAAASWSSDNTLIAQVTDSGIVIATGRGTTKIRARNPLDVSRQDSLTVTVTNASAHIDLNRTLDTIPSLGRSLTYGATVLNARGQPVSGAKVRWRAVNTAVATIDSLTGVATAVGGGTTLIIGTSDLVADTATLEVSNLAGAMQITPTAMFLRAVGDTGTITVTARNEQGNVIATATPVFASLNTAIATVSAAGLVTAVAPGSVVITATVDSVVTQLTVTVRDEPTVVAFTGGAVTMASVGETSTPAVSITNSIGTVLPRTAVNWTTGNPAVATVSASGVITATGAGSTQITMTSPYNGAITASTAVTISDVATAVTVTPAGASPLTGVGRSISYQATVRNALGRVITGAPVTWSSSNPAAVTIDASSGLATAQAIGSSTITATSGTATMTATVSVTNDAVSIDLTPATDTIPNLGGTLALTAVALNDFGRPLPASQLSWSSETPAVATVSASGVVTAVASGTTRIIVTATGGKKDTTLVFVANAPTTVAFTVGSVSLTSLLQTASPAIDIKNSLGAVLTRDAVLWTTDAPSIATVSTTGVVTARGLGTANITATSPFDVSKKSTIPVTVTDVPAAATVSPSGTTTLTATGRTATFSATVTNALGGVIASPTVTWSSSTPAVATIDPSSGVATAVAVGSTTITATSGTATATATLTVTNNAVQITVTPERDTIFDLAGTKTLAGSALNDFGRALPAASITWTSLDPTIATVNSSGVVTASSTNTGLARIEVSAAGGVKDTSFIRVLNVPRSLAITGPVSITSVGGTKAAGTDFTINFKNLANAALPATSVTWTTNAPSVATVSSAGVITAVAVGSATITATSPFDGSLTASVTVNVTDVPASATISPSGTTTLTAAGRTVTYAATVRNALGGVILSPTVTYTSQTPSVATIDPSSGIATAVAAGSTTITAAAAGGVTATATLSVTNDAVQVQISPERDTILDLGGTLTVSAAALNDFGRAIPSANLTFSSLDPTIATVSSSGVVTASSSTTGVARIQVAAPGGLTDTAFVTVANAPRSLSITGPVSITSVGGTKTAGVDFAITFRNALLASLPATSVVWTTNAPSVATVSASGVVTAVGVGSATITATSPYDGALSTTVTINVTDVPASVTVAPAGTTTLTAVGRTATFTAIARNALSSVITGASITWSSSNTAIATIDASGVATAVAPGTVTITATSGAVNNTATLTVTNNAVAVLMLVKRDTILDLGGTLALSAVALNDFGRTLPGTDLTWSTLDPTIGTVSASGVVTAVATGTARIRVTAPGGPVDTAYIYMANAPRTIDITAATISLASIADSIKPAMTLQNSAAATLPRGSVIWTTSAPSVAFVDDTGLVVATGTGTAVIRAQSPFESGRFDEVTVTVTNAAASIVLNRTTDSLTALGRTIDYSAIVRNARNAAIPGASVTWSSTNTGVATIGTSGIATAVGTGTTTIKASFTGVPDASAILRVGNDPASVSLSPAAAAIHAIGATTTLTASVRNDLGATIASPPAITWSSSNTSVATVAGTTGASQVITAAGVGTATITATVNGVSSNVTVTVTNEATTIDITTTPFTMASINDSTNLALTASNATATVPKTGVTWSSANTSVVTVNDTGLVVARGTGAAFVRAISPFDGTIGDSVLVTVTNAAATVTLSSPSDSMTAPGQSVTFSATAKNARNATISSPTFVWESTDSTVVLPAADGTLSAVGYGTATITAKSGTAVSTGATVAVINPTRIYVDKDHVAALKFGTAKRPYSKVQDAINSADAGDTVYVVRAGTAYAENLTLTTPITLLGDSSAAGCATTGCATPTALPTLSHAFGSAAITASGGAPQKIRYLAVRHAAGVTGPAYDGASGSDTLDYFYVNPAGGAAAGYGIRIRQPSGDVLVHRSGVRSVKLYGIRVDTAANVRVDTVTVSDLFSNAVGILLTKPTTGTIRLANVTGGTDSAAVQVREAGALTVASPTITAGANASASGLRIASSSGVSVTSATITGGASSRGVDVSSTTGFSLTGGTVTGTGNAPAVYLDDADGALVSGVSIISGSGISAGGVAVTNSDTAVISGGSINAATTSAPAVYFSGTTRSGISSAVVTAGFGNAVLVSSGDRTLILGGTINGGSVAPAVLSTASATTMVRNATIAGDATQAAIRFTGETADTVRNTVISGGSFGIDAATSSVWTFASRTTGSGTGYRIGASSRLISLGDSIGTTTGACVTVLGAADSVNITNMGVGGCDGGTGAAMFVGTGSAKLSVLNSRLHLGNQQGVLFSSDGKLTLTSDSLLGPGTGSGTAAGVVQSTSAAATLALKQNWIVDFPGRVAIQATNANTMTLDSNFVSRNSVGLDVGTVTTPTATSNSFLDNTLGATNLPNALIAGNFWGDSIGPRRWTNGGTADDSSAVGDSVTYDGGGAGSFAGILDTAVYLNTTAADAALLRKLRVDPNYTGLLPVGDEAGPVPLAVRVVDAKGRPVSGVSVTFTVSGSDPLFDMDPSTLGVQDTFTGTTDRSGVIKGFYRTAAAGTFTITVTSGSLGSVTYTVTRN